MGKGRGLFTGKILARGILERADFDHREAQKYGSTSTLFFCIFFIGITVNNSPYAIYFLYLTNAYAESTFLKVLILIVPHAVLLGVQNIYCNH